METITLKFCERTGEVRTTIVLASQSKYLPRKGEHVTAREQNEKAISHTGVIFCIEHYINDQEIDVLIYED